VKNRLLRQGKEKILPLSLKKGGAILTTRGVEKEKKQHISLPKRGGAFPGRGRHEKRRSGEKKRL